MSYWFECSKEIVINHMLIWIDTVLWEILKHFLYNAWIFLFLFTFGLEEKIITKSKSIAR